MNIKMLCGSFLGLDLNKQVSKIKFCCFKMTQVMLSPSDFIGDTWPRASQYLHHIFCLFILFMLHFFYLVNHVVQRLSLMKYFRDVATTALLCHDSCLLCTFFCTPGAACLWHKRAGVGNPLTLSSTSRWTSLTMKNILNGSKLFQEIFFLTK